LIASELGLPAVQETPERKCARDDTRIAKAIDSADIDGPSEAADEVGYLPCSIGVEVQLRSLIEFVKRFGGAPGEYEDRLADPQFVARGQQLAVLHRGKEPAQPAERRVVQ